MKSLIKELFKVACDVAGKCEVLKLLGSIFHIVVDALIAYKLLLASVVCNVKIAVDRAVLILS